MKKEKVMDIIAWIAFGVMLVYLFLKLVGIIHSPLSVDLIALLSAAYFVGRYAKKIDDIFSDIGFMKSDLRKLNDGCPVLKDKGN